MAAGRKVERGEARALVQAWRASGEAMSSWCTARGLNWYSLNAHVGRMPPEPQLELAEVVLAANEVDTEPDGGRYRIHIGEIIVDVDDDFRDDTLRRLLRAVASAC